MLVRSEKAGGLVDRVGEMDFEAPRIEAARHQPAVLCAVAPKLSCRRQTSGRGPGYYPIRRATSQLGIASAECLQFVRRPDRDHTERVGGTETQISFRERHEAEPSCQ